MIIGNNFEGYNAATVMYVSGLFLILNVGKGRQTISTILLSSSYYISNYYDYTLETSVHIKFQLQLEVAQERTIFTGVLQMLKLYHTIMITSERLKT